MRRKEMLGTRSINDYGIVKQTSEFIPSRYNKTKWHPLSSETNFRISHYCCQKMKKSPMKKFQSREKLKPMVGTMADESRLREQAWLKHGCNSFDGKALSMPLAFWTEQDVLGYIKENDISIASVYGRIVSTDNEDNDYEDTLIPRKLKCTGCDRTGCIFCGFGFHLEKGETRFQRLARTHPKQYEYCLGGGQWVDNPAYDPTLPEYDGDWKNWNPKRIWVPSKKGLGMKFVFDQCNEIYGKEFMRYE